jgi:hypothetical protein
VFFNKVLKLLTWTHYKIYDFFFKPFVNFTFIEVSLLICEKKESGMENVPCEVFMNEEKIETNLMEEENPNL